MSIASTVTPSAAATAAANATKSSGSTSSTATTTSGTSALGSLAGNFQDFLSMLMTQLKNQDPTTPMDSNQFTSELVQFSSVEQQINTNSSLGQLIQLTQSGQVLQSSSIVGQTVDVTSDKLSLQNGSAGINFTAPTAEPVTVTVAGANGATIKQSQVSASQGANSWAWDGKDSSGAQWPDGAYSVTVTSGGVAVPFTVSATATGVTQTSTGMNLSIGGQSVPFSAVTSLVN